MENQLVLCLARLWYLKNVICFALFLTLKRQECQVSFAAELYYQRA